MNFLMNCVVPHHFSKKNLNIIFIIKKKKRRSGFYVSIFFFLNKKAIFHFIFSFLKCRRPPLILRCPKSKRKMSPSRERPSKKIFSFDIFL